MLFNSVDFAFFLPIFFILYWSVGGKNTKLQNLIIVLFSYLFYSWWDYRFLSLIIFSTSVDYLVGLKLSSVSNKSEKNLYFLFSIIVNIGFLGFFKYYNFFIDSFTDTFRFFGYQFGDYSLKIILPVGISFYTFQTLSYTIDIYRNKILPTKDFVAFSAFVCFFPQLVAGPIERATNMLPQFLNKRTFNYKNAITGFSLMTYGFFKKVVIADRLAIYVNSVFENIATANTISLIIGIIFFSFQIYADFSGYSLIARGISKLLGFDLMINFNIPYIAENISDFWRRWHISLSTWFRDYLYIPLGGNRVSTIRNYFNLMIVFLVSGLWHGANWTFVIWGGLHGIYQILYVSYSKINFRLLKENNFSKYFNILIVYLLVTFAWIFFRSNNIEHAFEYINKMFEFNFSFNLNIISAGKGPLNLLVSIFAIVLLYVTYLLPKQLNFKNASSHTLFNILLIFIIFILGVDGETDFIYFQF